MGVVKGKTIGLASCPHCGKEVEFFISGYTAYIFCSDHNCWGGAQVSWGTLDEPYIFIERLKANWNKRVPEQNALLKAIAYIEKYRNQICEQNQDEYSKWCCYCVEALDEAIRKARAFVV